MTTSVHHQLRNLALPLRALALKHADRPHVKNVVSGGPDVIMHDLRAGIVQSMNMNAYIRMKIMRRRKYSSLNSGISGTTDNVDEAGKR